MKLKTIDAREADRLVACGATLLDVRERHEIDREQIEGAVAVPLSRFAEANLEPFRGRKVIFFCHSGGRTRLYAAKLAARLQGIGGPRPTTSPNGSRHNRCGTNARATAGRSGISAAARRLPWNAAGSWSWWYRPRWRLCRTMVR